MELGRDVCIAKFAIQIWSKILMINFLLQELTFLKVNFHKRSAERKKNPPAAGQNDVWKEIWMFLVCLAEKMPAAKNFQGKTLLYGQNQKNNAGPDTPIIC